MELRQNNLEQRQKLYRKNIEILAEKYPDVVDKINNLMSTNKVAIKQCGKKNLPNIYMDTLGKYYYDKKDPIEDVKKHILSLKLQKTSIAIFLGFGLGYELLFYGNALSERLQTQYVLVIEKDVEIFKLALEWIDISLLLQDERIKFIIGTDTNCLADTIRNYLMQDEKLNCLEAVSTIYHPSSLLLDEEYYFHVINTFNQVGQRLLAQRKGLNTIFEKNMKALREHYPELTDKIIALQDNDNYKIIRTGTHNICNLWMEDKKTLYYDFENPIQDTEWQIEQLKLVNTRVALFLGCGLGYELEVFKNKIAIEQNTVGVIVVEKDIEIFRKALEITDLTEYICQPKIKIMVGTDADKFFMEFQNFLYKNNDVLWLMKTLKPIYHPSSFSFDKEYYLQAIREIKKATAYMLEYYGNDPNDSLIGVENMLLNINEILRNPGINLLKNKFANKPAIVVSSGPSLNKNKHLLKGLENKAVIIAADSALRVLTQMGIKPHFVTALERTKPLLRLFDNFEKKDTENIYLAACPVIDPCVYEAYQGPRLIVYRDFDHFKWLEIEKGILEIKHSSGNMSYKIAEYLGCNPIILIGQDLSYGKDGTTHAIGTNLENDKNLQQRIKDRGLLEVRGNVDETVLTSKMWHNFLKGYEQDLREYKGVCINSTEGGAYIEGTQVMPFNKAIEKYIGEDIKTLEIIRNNTQVLGGKIEKEKEQVINIILDTIIYMNKVINLCEKGISIIKNENKLKEYFGNSNLLTNESLKEINNIEKKIMDTKRKLTQDKKIFQLFFMHIIQPYIIRFEMEMAGIPDCYDNISLAKVKVLLEQERFFMTVKGIAEICVNMLNSTQRKIESEVN